MEAWQCKTATVRLFQFHNSFHLLTIKSDFSLISVKYLQHHTWSMGHSGQVGGSLQQGCYPPTSWLQPQLILPLQSFLPSFLHCIPTTREKSTSMHPCLVLTCCRFVLRVATRGSVPAYRALTTKQDICTVWEWAVCPQTVSQTCITREVLKASLWASAKKRESETTQIQHKNSTEGGEWGGRYLGEKYRGKKNRTPESINVESFRKRF